ncbi:hypothetical protein [Catellatospora citrea]|uniref:Uncharacterized protein n=1 Tax=Catellatospora citrea TaxID=53366 RepID=A0A8J3KD87_9ACTN|nr:hypothetical protein [Catellatospora citrea]RKE08108.1 hypothetical protein C8E86_2951 [Catellatospora citrea]GIF98489.1 hypothetical protein Cci01nite_35830 [Catellatospora citrea]
MVLHRARPPYLGVAFFLLGGFVLIWSSLNGWELRFLFIPLGSGALFGFGLLSAVCALGVLAAAFRPAPVVLDESGLALRTAGIKRTLPWSAVDAVLLEPYTEQVGGRTETTARLILVPAAGVDLGVSTDYRNMIDGRPSVILVSLKSVRVSTAEVTTALTRYAGGRFVDGVTTTITPA